MEEKLAHHRQTYLVAINSAEALGDKIISYSDWLVEAKAKISNQHPIGLSLQDAKDALTDHSVSMMLTVVFACD